ncbi:MAG: ABC transporter substrate-binding protein [Chloroflexi bacterium]|nr:ABC transporter substrate-binding protein [Chloroflexota bacterium]
MGGTAKQGIDLAIDEINAKGGIDGRKVQLIVEDDEGDPGKATTATTKLIQKDKVVAILGAAVTATTVAAAQVANAEKVVILSPMFTGDQLTAPGSGMDYVFRVGLPDRYTVGKLVQYGSKKFNKIGVIGDSGPAGQSVTAVATKGLKDLGKEIVGAQSFDMRAPDVTPQLLNLQKAGAEAIIAQAVPGDCPTILKGIKQIGWNVQVLGHLGFADPTIRNVALDAAQGVYGIDSYDPDKADQKKLMDAYTKKYGAEKLVYWGAVFQGYDAMMVMAEGLKKANFDKSKVKESLESIKDFPAISGNKDNKISFGPGQHDGNRENSVVLLQVKGKDLIKIE